MRKLALLATLAVAAFAVMAPSSMAATQVRDAATGQLCSNVSPAINKASPPVMYRDTGTPHGGGTQPSPYQSGGCTIRMQANVPVNVQESGWAGARQCYVNYDLHLGPDGWGYANNFVWDPTGHCRAWKTPGSRIIMPRGVAPTLGGTTLYTAVNAATDLNMEMWAKDTQLQSHWGFLSFDVYLTTPTQGNTYTHGQNQQLGGSMFGNGYGFRGGSWYRINAAGNTTNVTITH